MLFTHFYLTQKEKKKAALCLQQAYDILVLNQQLFYLPENSQKIYPLVSWTAKHVFHRWSYKNNY